MMPILLCYIAKTPLTQPHHRVSRAPATTPKTPRASSSSRLHVEPSSGPRYRSPSAERASGFGGKGPRKDTRPINDKMYQSTMLNKIDEFFAGIAQSSILNPSGSLRPVTLKIFIEATNCLLNLLDVKHEVSINNYTEELPKIAKKIHYPGAVTKSWLKTANTMHSWPHVLAWLSWLVEVCEARDLAELTFKIEKLPFVGSEEDQESKRINFLALIRFYVAWNEERLDDEAALVEQHLRELNNMHGDIETNIAEAAETLEKETASLEEMDQHSKDLDAELNGIKEFLDGLKHEEKTENELIQSTENRIKRVEQEIKHLKHDTKALQDQIQKDYNHHKELHVLIANQRMSVKERDAIIEQCSEVQNYIQQFDTHIKDIKNEVYAMDMKLASSNMNLYKAILAYNKDIIMHLGCDPDIDLEELKLPEGNLLSHDFMEALPIKETAMLNVKENIKKQLDQTETLIEANTLELESLQENLRKLQENNKDRVEKLTEQRIFVQQIQQKTKENEMKLKDQIKNVKIDIVKLEQSMPDLDAALNEVSECRDKLQAVERKYQFIEKSLERFFDKFYNILSNHRNNLMDTFNKSSKP